MMKKILLSDGWHTCDFESFQFVVLSLPVQASRPMDVTAAVWLENGQQFMCPVASIQALQLEGESYGELVKGGGATVFSGLRTEEPVAAAA